MMGTNPYAPPNAEVGDVDSNMDKVIHTINKKVDKYAIPENVALTSIGIRLVGQVIDHALAFGMAFGAAYVIDEFNGSNALETVVFLIILAGYFLFADALPNGQSIGKRLLGIRVISLGTQRPCSFWQSFQRNLAQVFGPIDWVPIFFKGSRRAGDLMADTIVIKAA